MRFWSKAVDPLKPASRIRPPSKKATSTLDKVLGQRPLFSVPGDDSAPESSELPFESDMDPTVPSDKSPGNSDESVFTQETLVSTLLFRDFNVSGTPSEEELAAGFGQNRKIRGFVGSLSDNAGNPMYLVASNGKDWYYVRMTKADPAP